MFSKFLVFLLLPFSCIPSNLTEKETSSECNSPVAEAGSDILTNIGLVVTLDGTRSQWCTDLEEDLIYKWNFVSIPSDSAVSNLSLSENIEKSASNPKFLP